MAKFILNLVFKTLRYSIQELSKIILSLVFKSLRHATARIKKKKVLVYILIYNSNYSLLVVLDSNCNWLENNGNALAVLFVDISLSVKRSWEYLYDEANDKINVEFCVPKAYVELTNGKTVTPSKTVTSLFFFKFYFKLSINANCFFNFFKLGIFIIILLQKCKLFISKTKTNTATILNCYSDSVNSWKKNLFGIFNYNIFFITLPTFLPL